jgi:hypothetical protein
MDTEIRFRFLDEHSLEHGEAYTITNIERLNPQEIVHALRELTYRVEHQIATNNINRVTDFKLESINHGPRYRHELPVEYPQYHNGGVIPRVIADQFYGNNTGRYVNDYYNERIVDYGFVDRLNTIMKDAVWPPLKLPKKELI